MLGQKIDNLSKERLAFVLIELLVAISIFVVVASAVYTTLYVGIRSYKATQKETRLNQKLNHVLDRLSVELRNCYDADYNKEDNSGGFIGDSGSISFFTIKDVYRGDNFQKMLARITYNFKEGRLFKKTQLDKDAFLDSSDFEEKEILSGIKELNFKYLYFKEAQNSYEWRSKWPNKSIIPQGIVIEINLDGSPMLKRYIYLAQGEIVRE